MTRLCEVNFKLLKSDLSIFHLNTSTYFKENLRITLDFKIKCQILVIHLQTQIPV